MKLHLVGPAPPPRGGATLTFELFRDNAKAAQLGLAAMNGELFALEACQADISVVDVDVPMRLRTSQAYGERAMPERFGKLFLGLL